MATFNTRAFDDVQTALEEAEGVIQMVAVYLTDRSDEIGPSAGAAAHAAASIIGRADKLLAETHSALLLHLGSL